MKRQELLFLLFGTLFLLIVVQYYFSTPDNLNPSEQESGHKIIAPKKIEPVFNQPLMTEIDFKDGDTTAPEVETVVKTQNASYTFSNYGAALKNVTCIRQVNGASTDLVMFDKESALDHERLSFLLALQEKTPLYYELVSHQKDDQKHTVVYRAGLSNNGFIKKTFVMHEDSYQIDCTISIDPGAGKSVQPRIFFASPLLPDLGIHDGVTGVVNNGVNQVSIIQKRNDTFDAYWVRPTLFGTQDRYFIWVMVKDAQAFTQRGYFKAVDLDKMYGILEGPMVSQPSEWTVSFYVGPKEEEALMHVDKRLEYTLNYGWFSFISKPLSKFVFSSVNYFKTYTGSYGWALVIVILLFRILLFPFTYDRGSAQKKRAEFEKRLTYIQQKYKHDPQALAEARAELVREHGMPGLGGCFVGLLQLPLFWALSIILANRVEFYKTPLLWVKDLSSPDQYYIFPFLAAIAIVMHMYMTSPTKKQRFISIIMAIVMGSFLSNLSAGLTLYIVMGTLFGVIQLYMGKKS